MGADPESRKVWAHLIDTLRRNVGLIEQVPDSGRITDEALRAIPGGYYHIAEAEIAGIPESERTTDKINEIVEKHKAVENKERTRLASLTIEQRISEILEGGRRLIPPPPDVVEDMARVKLLSEQGVTIKQIALSIGRSEQTVKRYRKKLGIKKRMT
jgi:DNA-binding NarL/FixJ family response regulator